MSTSSITGIIERGKYMSFFEDYVEDGLCCSICGEVIDNTEPGYPRTCKECSDSQRQSKIERNKQRIKYAIEQFKKHNIEYVLKNEKTGHFHARRKVDDELLQFWAGTGKIIGNIGQHKEEIRGIHNFIKLLESEDK